MSDDYDPDAIDMMNEHELRDELRQALTENARCQKELLKLVSVCQELHDVTAARYEAQRRLGTLREALECLLPGLIFDKRYAEPDDDHDALQSRIDTVTTALRAVEGQELLDVPNIIRSTHSCGGRWSPWSNGQRHCMDCGETEHLTNASTDPAVEAHVSLSICNKCGRYHTSTECSGTAVERQCPHMRIDDNNGLCIDCGEPVIVVRETVIDRAGHKVYLDRMVECAPDCPECKR